MPPKLPIWKLPKWMQNLLVQSMSQIRWLYVATDNFHIHGFQIDPLQPGLTPINGSPFNLTGGQPVAVAGAIVPNVWQGFPFFRSKVLYAANSMSNSVDEYFVDQDGSLTMMKQSPVPARWNPSALAVHPNNHFVYVTNFSSHDISLYQMDRTGALNPQGYMSVDPNSNPVRLAITPNGTFVYVVLQASNQISAYAVANDGTLTPVSASGGKTATGNMPVAIAIDPTGRLVYVANQQDNSVSQYRIQSTGALQEIGNPVIGSVFTPSDVKVDPSGKFVYVTNLSSNDGGDDVISAYAIGQDGSLSLLQQIVLNLGVPQDALTIDQKFEIMFAATSLGGGVVSVGPIDLQTGVPSGNQPFTQTPLNKPISLTIVVP